MQTSVSIGTHMHHQTGKNETPRNLLKRVKIVSFNETLPKGRNTIFKKYLKHLVNNISDRNYTERTEVMK